MLAEKQNYFLRAFSTLGVSGFRLLVSTVAGAGNEVIVSGAADWSFAALLQAARITTRPMITEIFFIFKNLKWLTR